MGITELLASEFVTGKAALLPTVDGFWGCRELGLTEGIVGVAVLPGTEEFCVRGSPDEPENNYHEITYWKTCRRN